MIKIKLEKYENILTETLTNKDGFEMYDWCGVCTPMKIGYSRLYLTKYKECDGYFWLNNNVKEGIILEFGLKGKYGNFKKYLVVSKVDEEYIEGFEVSTYLKSLKTMNKLKGIVRKDRIDMILNCEIS